MNEFEFEFEMVDIDGEERFVIPQQYIDKNGEVKWKAVMKQIAKERRQTWYAHRNGAPSNVWHFQKGDLCVDIDTQELAIDFNLPVETMELALEAGWMPPEPYLRKIGRMVKQ